MPLYKLLNENLKISGIEIDDGVEEYNDEEFYDITDSKGYKKNEKEAQKIIDDAEEIGDIICLDKKPKKPAFKDATGKKDYSEKGNTKVKMLPEEYLNEAPIPPELARGYRKGNRFRGFGENPDLQKADYREITPEEAKEKIAAGEARNLRVLLDGRIVTLKPDGRGDEINRFNTYNKGYQKRTGNVETDTYYMPTKHILDNADKIYYTNEESPEAQRDKDLLATRALNPESPNYKIPGDVRELNTDRRGYYRGDNYSDVLDNNKIDRYRLSANQFFKNDYWDSLTKYQQIIKRIGTLKRAFANGKMSQEQFDKEYNSEKIRLLSAFKDIGKFYDRKAILRGLDSEVNLRNKYFPDFKQNKDDESDAEYEINSNREKIANAAAKDYAEEPNKQLKSLDSDIRRKVRDKAEQAMRAHAANAKKDLDIEFFTNRVEKNRDRKQTARDNINKILKKKPSGVPESLLNTMASIDNDKLCECIINLYPEGCSEDKLIEDLKCNSTLVNVLKSGGNNE